MNIYQFPWILSMAILTSCIGTDTVDGPLSGEKLEISPKTESLLVGQKAQLTAEYTNAQGETEQVSTEFRSLTPSILSVDQSGLVTALAKGTGEICAAYGLLKSDTASINVVGSENDIAEIVVSGDEINIEIGAETTLRANAYTVNEIPVVTSFEWSSEDEAIATVDNQGLVTGIARGFTTIIARADGIEGSYGISVGLGTALATFMGASGYTAKGTAELSLTGREIILTLSSDFETSFALGTFVYLANSTTGSEVKAQGLELAEIKMNGSHTFNVSEIAEDMNKTVSFNEYKYVVILCEPAALTFGYGELTY